MRLRNIKNADENIKKSNYYIHNPFNYKGKTKTLFNNDNAIHVELGMGKGDFIITSALMNPHINFIGIEKFGSVLVKATIKLENLKISNLKLIKIDVLNILDLFDKEIDVLYLNFSDPWPKNRHEHRRLTSPKFLKKYDQIFKNIKTIIMKTDNRQLFEYSIISFTSFGYKINQISLDYHQDNPKDNIETEYECKFKVKGPIYRIKVTK